MVSIEAVASLKKSKESWETYRSTAVGLIDLTGADLRGAELRDRVFDHCDMSAANLANTNLDGAHFQKSKLAAAVLDNSSLVGCTFETTTLSDSNISRSVIRATTFRDCTIERLEVESGFIGDCTVSNSQITDISYLDGRFINTTFTETRIVGVDGVNCNLDACRFEGCTISRMTLRDSTVRSCYLHEATVSDTAIGGPQFTRNTLTDCQLTRFAIRSDNVEDLDLTGSALREVDLADLGLRTAIMLDAAVTGCRWPAQKGHVTLTGRYIPSPTLLTQPVQDLKGVPPLMRRETADAQYLVTRLEHRNNLFDPALMRLWGLTSAFGRSLTRLLACSAIAIMLDAVALLFAIGKQCEMVRHPMLIINALSAAAQSFVGISVTSNLSSALPAKVAIVASRIAGFAALGVWISVAAQKVSRLSSE